MIDDKIPRRINPKGIGLIYIYIYRNIYIYIYIYSRSELQNNAGSSPCTAQALNKTVSNAFL